MQEGIGPNISEIIITLISWGNFKLKLYLLADANSQLQRCLTLVSYWLEINNAYW